LNGDCSRTSGLLMRHLPLSLMEMRWLAPQSLCRTRSAADALGFANHGLTCCAITV